MNIFELFVPSNFYFYNFRSENLLSPTFTTLTDTGLINHARVRTIRCMGDLPLPGLLNICMPHVHLQKRVLAKNNGP